MPFILPTIDPELLKLKADQAKAELEQACRVPVPHSPREFVEVKPSSTPAYKSSVTPSAKAALKFGSNKTQSGFLFGSAGKTDKDSVNGIDPDLLCGTWVSSIGQMRIFRDARCNRLAFEEKTGWDGDGYFHGWLTPKVLGDESGWIASLSKFEEGDQPWYGPSFGEKPEDLGEIFITYCNDGPSPTVSSKSRVAEETIWSDTTSYVRGD